VKEDYRVPGWNYKRHLEPAIIILSTLLILAGVGFILSRSFFSGSLFVVCLFLWILVLYFFRDPFRDIIGSPELVVSPGDGEIKDITQINDEDLKISLVRIGIFLSVFDVHVQRIPINGKVSFVTHKTGKHLPAYASTASQENEQILMGLETDRGIVLVNQISGILARKCLNFTRPGDQVIKGQRYGLIKFGSRVELFLPLSAKLSCQVGETVKGGLTVLAELPEEST
jgi:phosphatidylserine decarboxylase